MAASNAPPPCREARGCAFLAGDLARKTICLLSLQLRVSAGLAPASPLSLPIRGNAGTRKAVIYFEIIVRHSRCKVNKMYRLQTF